MIKTSLVQLRSNLLSNIPNIQYFFSKAIIPENQSKVLESVFPNRWSLRPLKKQIHSTRIVTVNTTSQDCGDCDGLMTGLPGIPLPILTADCIPVLIASMDGSWVGALHAGWKGVFNEIAKSFIDLALLVNVEVSRCVVVFGPHIRGCCYQVSDERRLDFELKFGTLDKTLGKMKGGLQVHKDTLNLSMYLRSQFEKAGVPPSQIEDLEQCTFCSPLEFYSFRKNATRERQISVIQKL